jgi:hypothetical protein
VSTSGRCNPELDPDAGAPRLERVGGSAPGRRWPVAVSALVVVTLVGLLWAKPWQNVGPETGMAVTPTEMRGRPIRTADPARTPAPTKDHPTPTPSPTPDPLELAVDRRQCQSTSEWRMVSAEVTVTRGTRTMYAVEPAVAAGPTDEAIPVSRLFARSLRAVGVCVPYTPAMSPADELTHVVLWRVDENGDARQVSAPVIADEPLFALGEAYWAPPAGEERLWPEGRYVFEIRRIAGAESRWMGIDFVPTDERGAASTNS